MAFAEFTAGDLVKLIKGAPGESKAIWRIKYYLITSDEVKLEKYNGPEALSREMTTEKGNVRGLTDDELDGLAMWSPESFVRTTYQKDTYIGKVRRIIWDREKGVSAQVTLAGRCIPEGVTQTGEPHTQSIKHYRVTLEESKLVDCTKAEVEWLKAHFAQMPEKWVLPEPQYELISGNWYVNETVILTSAPEIVKAAAEVEKQNEAGPTYARFLVYGSHEDENGERYYTRKQTRLLDPEEVERHKLRLGEPKRNENPRNEGSTPKLTFDDILHPDKLNH